MPTNTVFLCPMSSIFQWFTDAGIVLSGGKINTYLAGTTTPTNTWTDQTGIVLNSNPVILASNGRMNSVQIWQGQGITLKIVITDANNNQLGPTFDQITGINDPTTVQTLYANPATGFGADLIANVMRSYDLFSSVRAANVPTLAAGQTLVIDVQAAVSPNDGFGGLFYWNASSTATDDGVNVIKPTAAGSTGRYLRQSQVAVASQTLTLNGYATPLSAPMLVTRTTSNLITILITPGGTLGASNSTALNLTGLPSTYQPVLQGSRIVPCMLEDNGALIGGWATLAPGSGTITFGTGINNNTAGFTAGGTTKGLPAGWTIQYQQ